MERQTWVERHEELEWHDSQRAVDAHCEGQRVREQEREEEENEQHGITLD